MRHLYSILAALAVAFVLYSTPVSYALDAAVEFESVSYSYDSVSDSAVSSPNLESFVGALNQSINMEIEDIAVIPIMLDDPLEDGGAFVMDMADMSVVTSGETGVAVISACS